MHFLKTGLLLISSFHVGSAQLLKLSTPSDSALHYYYEGWRQVMDEGNYSAAEVAYRQMMTYDPKFLIGLSLLARISQDLNERQDIEKQIEIRKTELNEDEKLLLDVFIELVKLTNLRETDPEMAKVQMEKAFGLGEQNLQVVIHKYPDEIYYKAEYIEVLHRNHGAQMALDSLYALASQEQQNRPFLLGYAAQMEAEAGQFEKALQKAIELNKIMGDRTPKPQVVYSDIYFKMGNFELAQMYINEALTLDPQNIEAIRLQARIKNEFKKE